MNSKRWRSRSFRRVRVERWRLRKLRVWRVREMDQWKRRSLYSSHRILYIRYVNLHSKRLDRYICIYNITSTKYSAFSRPFLQPIFHDQEQLAAELAAMNASGRLALAYVRKSQGWRGWDWLRSVDFQVLMMIWIPQNLVANDWHTYQLFQSDHGV